MTSDSRAHMLGVGLEVKMKDLLLLLLLLVVVVVVVHQENMSAQ